jgi:hypothetical protein
VGIFNFLVLSKMKLYSGSGSTISYSNELYVSMTGSGDVYYKGNPAVFVQISGSGKVIKR